MSCLQTIADYGLRSIGIGERLLPKTDFTLCQQFTLIGSGLIWNVYFAILALSLGFFLSISVALARNSTALAVRKPAEWFIFVFRGSPLFIQFFFAYFLFLSLTLVGFRNSCPHSLQFVFPRLGFSKESQKIKHFF